MKPTHYGAILVRLFAIALVVYAIRQSSILVESLSSGELNGYEVSAGFVWASALGPLVVALILWCFPMTIAAWSIRPEFDQPLEPMSASSILSVLVLAIGLYVLYFAIADSVYWLTIWQMSAGSSYSGSSLYLDGERKAAMITTGLELFLALIFVCRAKSISAFMLRLSR